ncbi:P-loop containing nucleoside triphosphate hydrolase protein [Colletotrichum godetiae]|uniref:P-loop containing nucleoside triphosphate hydrolase protein n=1 Tax=Colletotrichum godetiae TaxID=1209918 RepID=A0AAJ0EMR3_9PEZI|nr:P-loop containing nucleoside triphosphate hydrolase protein [Colletotrichum godetiae]KAK1658965.1 P-loop containing nucleoside triphosphate hydrolase protein [Colletotrichum godetiae]
MADRRSPRSVLVYGLSGMGKSQICLKAISEQQHRFRSVFYVNASDKTIADSNYVEIFRICHIQHHWEDISVDEQIRITRTWLACQYEPWLLMIDNVTELSLPLSRYVPSTGSGTILVTSDESQWATDCHTYCQIRSMSDDQAFELLLKFKKPEVEPDVHEIQSAKIIAIKELGGLPLAIAQAGSYISNNHCTYSE